MPGHADWGRPCRKSELGDSLWNERTHMRAEWVREELLVQGPRWLVAGGQWNVDQTTVTRPFLHTAEALHDPGHSERPGMRRELSSSVLTIDGFIGKAFVSGDLS